MGLQSTVPGSDAVGLIATLTDLIRICMQMRRCATRGTSTFTLMHD